METSNPVDTMDEAFDEQQQQKLQDAAFVPVNEK
ncbi:hypothetical protein Tco_0350498, partial [Tanacetum coccineum]